MMMMLKMMRPLHPLWPATVAVQTWKYSGQSEARLEHKTCDILAAERLRLMSFENRLIIDSFQKAIRIVYTQMVIFHK